MSRNPTMNQTHFRKLEKMYLDANIQKFLFETTTVKVGKGQAKIGLTISEKYYHALDAMHGAVYFKLLDDAAFFAVNSMVDDVFVLTTSFNINLIRPVSKGTIKAIGKLRFASKKLFIADATLYNEEGKEIAFGTGQFTKSRIQLTEGIGYRMS